MYDAPALAGSAANQRGRKFKGMAKEDLLEFQGTVVELLPNAMFRVRLDNPFEVGTTTTGNITYPGYEHMKWVSLTEQMEHECLFVFSWPPGAVDPDTEYDADAKVRVEFRLEPTEKGTRLTITESGFQQFPESKRLEVLRSNAEGWDIQARNVAAHVEG